MVNMREFFMMSTAGANLVEAADREAFQWAAPDASPEAGEWKAPEADQPEPEPVTPKRKYIRPAASVQKGRERMRVTRYRAKLLGIKEWHNKGYCRQVNAAWAKLTLEEQIRLSVHHFPPSQATV